MNRVDRVILGALIADALAGIAGVWLFGGLRAMLLAVMAAACTTVASHMMREDGGDGDE